MKKITIEELLIEMEQFICDLGRYSRFIEFLKSKGYTEKEIEEVIEEARN